MHRETESKVLRIERRPDQVAVVFMDVASMPVNVLRVEHTEEFREVFTLLRTDASVQAIVFASGKPDGFIAGADIEVLKTVTTHEEGALLAQQGQEANDLLESLKKPVVAAIHGACLGGGLELALACHGRVASDHRSTKLGLPEVQLGLLPGAGGTQRLPQLIGVRDALDLLLSGKKVGASKAKRIGLVDEVVPRAILLEVAAKRALALTEPMDADAVSKLVSWLSPAELQEHALADNPLGRKVVFDQAREKVLEKTKGHYPAPDRILEVVRTGLASGFERGLKLEREAFGELAITPHAKSLMGLFLKTQELKKQHPREVDPQQDESSGDPLGVVGAGLMGAGIAQVTCSRVGLPVRLKDRDHAGVLRGLGHVREALDKSVARRRMTRVEADRTMSLVTGTTDYSGFDQCFLVVEAVFEDITLKRQVIRDLEAVIPERGIVASNTSALPISQLAEGAKRPGRILGMHYFSPVEKMPLLEVVAPEGLDEDVLPRVVEFGHRQGKTVVVVGDGPGFFTTRVLAPFLGEAARLVLEGNSVEAVDHALSSFGFPVGPLKLTDEIGVDVAGHVASAMHKAFGARMEPPPVLPILLRSERFGRKSGKGFYHYPENEPSTVDRQVYEELGVEPKRSDDLEGLAERCVLLFVNEAMRCLEEGIVAGPADGDIAAVFGLGFPPFLGGPFAYVDARSPKVILARLRHLEERYGERFNPAKILEAKASAGELFHRV